MGDVLRRRSRSNPNDEALLEIIEGERRSLTYAEFNNRVNRVAHGLRAKGLHQGDRIALVSANSMDFATVLFACYKAGFVVVPVNFLQNPDDVRFNFEHGEVKAVLYQSELEALCKQCSAGLDDVALLVSLGKTSGGADCTLEELAAGQSDAEILDVVIEDRSTAQVLYTSGTTSRPKGVETSHLALVVATLNFALSSGMQPGSQARSLTVLPMFHVTALCGLLTTVQLGGCYVIHSGFDPQAVVETLEKERIASTVMLPMMWNACLQVPGVAERNFSALNNALYGMAPMSAELLQRLRSTFGCDFHLGSGQTEFTPPPCMYFDHTPTEFEEGNYWGVPTLIGEQAVLDEAGRECAVGEVGEICWRGPLSMNGYLKNPQATADVRQHGWHHSGDLGFIDAKGQLMFVDRKKDIVKSGGENVSSCKVEAVIGGIDGVAVSAVIGLPHPHWGEAICAVVQPLPGAELHEEAIIQHCKQHLGRFEVPKAVVFADALALTGTGKVKKPELRQAHQKLFESVTDA